MGAREKFYRLEKWLEVALAARAYYEQGLLHFGYCRVREMARIRSDFKPWEKKVGDVIAELITFEHDAYGRKFSVIREKYDKEKRLILISAVENAIRKGTVKELFV